MPVYNSAFQQPTQGQPGAVLPFPKGLQVAGPIVPVQVEVPVALASQLQQAGQPVPTPIPGLALIDTGASVSAVDTSVIQRLGIHPVGTVQVGTAGGPQMQTTYPARFTFPGTNLPPIDFSQLLGANLVGQVIAGTGQPLIALFGRDILQHFVLVYNGPAAMFTLAY